jgi:uncharacterized protein (TIGR00730 family)
VRLKDILPLHTGTEDNDKKVSKTRWGKTPGADEEIRFLYGPQERRRELVRAIKIFFEFMRGFRALHFVGPCVTVFGSARFRDDHPYYRMARDVGGRLARAGFTVMTGGGPGIMEAANRGAFAGSSPSVGLNIQLPHEQSANEYQDVAHTFQHFFARKVMFVKLSCAFIMMPGGFGTLDELMEVLTLVQTGKIRKLPVILVGGAFWNGLLQWIRGTLKAEGMIGVDDPDLLRVIDDPQAVVEAIFEHYQSRGFEPSPQEREAELAL